MTLAKRAVSLLDVDNTLLDNDRVITDLMRHLERSGLCEAVDGDVLYDLPGLLSTNSGGLGATRWR